MKKEEISVLTIEFESKVQKLANSKFEFWFARDLQVLLGYEQWRNFYAVIDKAKSKYF